METSTHKKMMQNSNIASYPIMEHFFTLQGEGYHQGKAAYFIRLGGCNVGCVWCDVKDSWDVAAHPLISIEQIVNAAEISAAPIAVITGGEPLLHNLDHLTLALLEKGIETNIETSGAYSLSGTWNWICVSPKKFKAPLPEVLQKANELKIVIYHPSDFVWAETFVKEVPEDCKLFLQPEWSKRETVTSEIVNYIKEHPKWELSLQIHKFLNIP